MQEEGRGDSMCLGMDKTRRARELRVRGSSAKWGREERLPWRGLELGFEEEAKTDLAWIRQRRGRGHSTWGQRKSNHLAVDKHKMPPRNDENILA